MKKTKTINLKTIKIFFTFFIFLLINNISIGQTVEGYSFEKYKSNKTNITTKSKINYSSNKTALTFKTAIKDGYNNGKIDFASYYITITWGCGTGCISGAMVDVRSGKVYDLPVDDNTAWYGCFSDESNNKFESKYDGSRLIFYSNSKLFITRSCDEYNAKGITYFIFNWDETNKKFIKIKQFIIKF